MTTTHRITDTATGTTTELAGLGPAHLRLRWWQGPEPAWHKDTCRLEPTVDLMIGQDDAGNPMVHIPGITATLGANGAWSFADQRGVERLKEAAQGRRFDQHGVGLRLLPRADASLYGFGQHPAAAVDWRGRAATLCPTNRLAAIPYCWSPDGWGLLWDCAAPGSARFESAGLVFEAEAVRGISVVVCLGDSGDDLVAAYRHLTGPARLPPRWAFGYWQSRERYRSAEELAQTAEGFAERGLPLDVIVQDWRYWGEAREQWSSMQADETSFGDLGAAIARCHSAGARVAVSVWPTPGADTPLATELAEGQHLASEANWTSGRVYDAHNPAARAIYWRHAGAGLGALGVDAWWLDATEPEFGDAEHPWLLRCGAMADTSSTGAGDPARLNAYAVAACQGAMEYQLHQGERPCILTRSAWAGIQATGAIVWSGDINASWPELRRQVAAGLGFAASGAPWWTHDCGGFFSTGHDWLQGTGFPAPAECDPGYQELYLRWFQFSTLTTFMRSHGTDGPREPWAFSEAWCRDGVAEMLALRYRLLPMIYGLAVAAATENGTPMRLMAFDYPHEPAARDCADQYLLGNCLLVCPMLHPIHTSGLGEPLAEPTRQAWLPPGQWVDFWTGAELGGNRYRQIDAPLNRIPMLLRQGAVVALAPAGHRSSEPPDEYELRIVTGAVGWCMIPVDRADDPEPDDPVDRMIHIEWQDWARRLVIGRCPAISDSGGRIRFRLVVVRPGHGVGLADARGDVVIEYDGHPCEAVV